MMMLDAACTANTMGKAGRDGPGWVQMGNPDLSNLDLTDKLYVTNIATYNAAVAVLNNKKPAGVAVRRNPDFP